MGSRKNEERLDLIPDRCALYFVYVYSELNVEPAMLATVLPKLTNLKVFRCHMSGEALGTLLGILETSHPNLRGLAIAYALFS